MILSESGSPVAVIVMIVAVLSIVACATIPDNIPEDLSHAELIRLAQDEYNRFNWEAALLYYRTVVERFAEDPVVVVIAEYEIAYIYYKTKEYQIASELFEAVLQKYGDEEYAETSVLPHWVRILSENILSTIAEQRGTDTEALQTATGAE